MTGLGILALLVTGVITVVVGLWVLHIDRILRDPDLPDHEAAREAAMPPDDPHYRDPWQ